jgi:hypothetical protein
MDELSREEVRVVGCLAEKEMTTPDSYPLTLNALVAACNQTTNRDPVVRYDDETVRDTIDSLRVRSLARFVHQPGSRGTKYKHVLDEHLELDRPALAVLTVLLLRGPQTSGELRTRCDRMHQFPTPDDVDAVLDELAARADPLVIRLERQPGQKEARCAHLLGGAPDLGAAPAFADRPVRSASSGPSLSERVAALEAAVAELRAAVDQLRGE